MMDKREGFYFELLDLLKQDPEKSFMQIEVMHHQEK